MTDNQQYLSTYKTIMPEIINSVSSAVGAHVMVIVLERALWKTKIKYPEAEKISFSEEGVNLDTLDNLDATKAERIVNEFTLSIIETLSRLVGMQVAQKLTDKLLNETQAKGDK